MTARLVLALGAKAKLDLVPGVMDYAIPFSTLEDAHKVNEKLKELECEYFGKDLPVRVAVVGCGYSGVELAATISERLQHRGIVKAINVGKAILPNAPRGNRESALKVLSSRNVQLLPGYVVHCIRKDEIRTPEILILELQPAERDLQSQIVEADLVLWTVGTKPHIPPLLEPNDKSSGLPLNARGQVETDETLRVKGHMHIFALGDCCALRDKRGNSLPATAQVALQQADFVGWNLWAAINGRPLLSFRFQNVGEMLTLGRNDGAVSPSFLEGITLEGSIGHTARKFACLTRFPTDEHRFKAGISWLTKSAVEAAAFAQSSFTKFL